MTFNVSDGAAYAVLFSVLVFFTLLAMGSTDMLGFLKLPHAVKACCLLKKEGEEVHSADYFLSARNSAGAFPIAMSFFASGMGAWVVYGTTEMGATPQLSWLGVFGYSGASAFPAIIICFLGPMIRERYTDAFSTTDFGRQRYGRVMQITIALVSLFYMFIFIVAELTSISNVYALLSDNFKTGYAVSITLIIGFFTLFYTGLAGLPASIVTDKFQGIVMAVLVVTLTIAVTSFEENRVSPEEFALASNWTGEGAMAAVTLFIAIACAEMFNQATWQRVWAAEDSRALRVGYLWGSILVFLLMMFFGIMGMIAYAKDPESYDNFEKWAYLAFFDLLEPLADGWHIVVLIMVTALAASSLDSLQNGLTCIFSHDLVKIGWNPRNVTRILVVVLNIPAIYLASKAFDVISLFLVADLVCATSVFPTFLGLQTKDISFLKAPTELGAFLGCVSGVITVLVNGAINDAQGGLFQYFWLRNEGICALCGSKTLISFVVTPLISAIMTYVFTFLDLMVRGERARQPIFLVAFDKSDLEDTVNKDIDNVKDIDSGRSEEEEALAEVEVEAQQEADAPQKQLDADSQEFDA